MKCNHCGTEIADDSTFCEHCGKKVTIKKDKTTNPWWKRKWVIACGCVLLIGIILGIIGIVNGSRWNEIYNNQIATWPPCHGGDGTFYILQKGEDQSLVRVKGEFPIRIEKYYDYCRYHRDIYAQEGDHGGIGVFAILHPSNAVFFDIYNSQDNHRETLSHCEGKELCSDKAHIYGIDKDRKCGESEEWLNTIFASNRQPVKLGIDGEWKYIDMQGEIAISGDFKDAHTFRYGVAKVYSQITGLPYYIRPNGKVIELFGYNANHDGDILETIECSDFHYDWQREKAVAEVNVRYLNESAIFGILIDTEGNILEQNFGWNSAIMEDYMKPE